MAESVEELLLGEVRDRLAVLGSSYLCAFSVGLGCDRFFKDGPERIGVLDELMDLPDEAPLLARAAVRGCLLGGNADERAAVEAAMPYFRVAHPEIAEEAQRWLSRIASAAVVMPRDPGASSHHSHHTP